MGMGETNLYGIVFATIVIGLILVTANMEMVASEKTKAPPEHETIMFIDKESPTHYGSSCDDDVETDKFKFIKGGLKWSAASFPVTYNIDSVPALFKEDINDSFDEWDKHDPLPGDFFSEDSLSPNVVAFSDIDGPGGTLAISFLTFNSAKDMLRFVIIFDEDEAWNKPGGFDVQNVATHEVGHAVGLDHRNSPKDCMLTMFRFAEVDETAKQDLAIGDIEGIINLYS